MGTGSSSTTTTNVKTKMAVEAIANNIMNCTANANVSQKFTIQGDYNVVSNAKIVQNMKLSSSCAQDSKNIAELQQSVAAALKSSADSQSVSVLGVLGSSRANVNTTIENEVAQKITQSNVQNIITNSNAEQEFTIVGNRNIVDNFSMEQTYDIVLRNTQAVLNQMKSVQAIESASSSDSKATQTNFISDIIGSIFSGLTSMAGLWLIALLIFAYMFGPQLLNILFGGEDTEVAKARIEAQANVGIAQAQAGM